ncbi:MAG: hypothetical protein VX009_01880 [Pseudomonadota bacterium]|nr:hypothetical protein [Pseudomonadota bacterium]
MIDQQIVKFLIDWINENTTYSGPLLNLEIIDLTLKELQLKACRGKCPILGFFSPPNLIYIAKLDFDNLCNQSILLHEMIHVFQFQSGNEIQNIFKEKEAYEIQNKFLINESLKNDFIQKLNVKKCRSMQTNVLE